MKQLAGSILTLIVVLMCTACASDGYASASYPSDHINNNGSYVGISGAAGESGSTLDMYGTTDVGVGVRR